MTVSARDPAALDPVERFWEVADLLGEAYLRGLLTHSQCRKELAEPPKSEPSCTPVNGQEMPKKEAEWKTA